MRTIGIASAVIALVAADGAGAQRMVAHGPGVGAGTTYSTAQANGGGYPAPQGGGYGNHYVSGPQPRPIGVPQGGHRWGSKVGGHWWGGVNAPGGWNGYRRPYRGYALPGYWQSPRFGIDEWSTYGLSQPANGYRWMRYYDDAVLVDAGGSVYDTVGGLDWDRYDGGYDSDETVYAGPGDRGGYAQPVYAQPAYAQPAYAQPAYARPAPPPSYGAGYAQPGYAQPGYGQPAYEHRSNGVGGALAGAAVGGVAGNLIAGRGNRLGGTLIGAGVGAAAGYAIDRSANRRQPDYGAGYDRPPVAPRHAPPPPMGYVQPVPPEYGYASPPPPPRRPLQGGPGGWVSPDGRTTVTTTSAGYYGGGTTTVVVQTAPVVTTTTTELIEDDVTYTRAHRKWRRPASKVHIRCGC